MKILFIGGNGNISWHCVQKALDIGHEVWELNRSATLSTRRQIQPQVHKLTCDIHNLFEVKKLLKDLNFDSVCDFICFNEQQAQEAIELFKNKTNQFIYISSEAVYLRKTSNLPFKENCEQYNPEKICSYISGKIKAEQVFKTSYEKEQFPITIVRPAYTYDTIVPTPIGQNCYTATKRLLDGFPALVAGDGENLNTFTHSADFANAFIHLIGNKKCIGQDYHISSDEWLTWNDEIRILIENLQIKRKIINIPKQEALQLPFFEKDLMYQKMWHNIYDNSKIKRIIPNWTAKKSFSEGIQETITWLNENPIHKRINKNFDKIFDELYSKYK